MADDPTSAGLDGAVSAADGSAEGAGARAGPEGGLRGPAWIGTRVPAGAPIPVAGTWKLIEDLDQTDDADYPHDGSQPGLGVLRSFGRGDIAPPGGPGVSWQLEHLAVTVAAEHHDPHRGGADAPSGPQTAGEPFIEP
jgi:hypothetical protein